MTIKAGSTVEYVGLAKMFEGSGNGIVEDVIMNKAGRVAIVFFEKVNEKTKIMVEDLKEVDPVAEAFPKEITKEIFETAHTESFRKMVEPMIEAGELSTADALEAAAIVSVFGAFLSKELFGE